LHSLATTEQLRLGYDASNYNAFTVGSTGSLTIAATGTNPSITLTPGGTGVVAASSNLTITGSSNSIATVGSELISASDDRTFASDTGAWTKGANWTIGSGVATHTAGANNLTYTGLTPTAGASYQIKATVVTTVAGTLTPQIGGVSGSAVGQSTGTLTQHVWVIVGTNTTQFSFVPSSAWAGTIDDVTITQITPSTSILNLKNSDATSGPEFRSGGSGINVTAIGIDSGKHRITGSNAATLIGYRAGYLSTTGAQTAIGHQSGYSNTTGTQTAIGHQAGYSNTTGNQTAIGYQSGYSNTTGYQTAIGYQSGYSNTTGYQTAIGQSAGYYNTTGAQTAIGYSAGYYNTTGTQTAIGHVAGYSNTTGYQTAIGQSAGYSNTTGYQTALGYQAGYSNTTGTQTAIGYQAGYSNTTGYQTAIGHLAGYSNTTGTQTAIGYYSDHLAPTAITTSNAVAYAGSGVDAGTHRYRVVFVLTGGDTAGSDSKSVTTTSDNDQVDLSGIPTYVGPKTCTARKIYRTKATSSSSPYYLVATISDNTTTTYSDTTPDASISTLLPSPNAMAIGYQAKTIFSNDVVFGSDTGPASNIYFGKGIYSATPTTTTIYGTGGLGTDIAGAGLYLAGGKGTGTGNGGDVRIQVALPGSSGTTENSLTDVLNVIGSTGYVGIGTATASAKLHSLATTEQLRLGYDASNYNAFTVGSTGSLTIAATGTNPSITLTPGGTGTVSIAGNVGIGTSKLGFYGATPASKPSAYTVSNASEDRAYDANATTLDEIADVLGTLISDLKTLGLIG
jgi:hypothetical protein